MTPKGRFQPPQKDTAQALGKMLEANDLTGCSKGQLKRGKKSTSVTPGWASLFQKPEMLHKWILDSVCSIDKVYANLPISEKL